MKKVVLRTVASLGIGSACAVFVGYKALETFQWYDSRGYQTVTEPLTFLGFIGVTVKAGLVAFSILSVIASVKKWAEPVELPEESNAQTQTTTNA